MSDCVSPWLLSGSVAAADTKNEVDADKMKRAARYFLRQDPLGSISEFDVLILPIVGVIPSSGDSRHADLVIKAATEFAPKLGLLVSETTNSITSDFVDIRDASDASQKLFEQGKIGRIGLKAKLGALGDRYIQVAAIDVAVTFQSKSANEDFVAIVYSDEVLIGSIEKFPEAAFSLVQKMRQRFLEIRALRSAAP